ncbi:MAG TPA: rhodanese-like domain-containing protein [Candidatus Udaeobacter sp.]|nr:rhodanese-like domain-containing protein [Candidatus Udaeobacter sp.]
MNSHLDPAGPGIAPGSRSRPVRDALGLIVFGLLVGLAANALSPRGIPLVGDFSRGAALANRSEEELKELPPVVELADVKTAIASGDSLLVVLDARAPDAFAEGHLPGALNLSVENLDANYPPLKARLDRVNRIIVYCDGGDCELSHDLAEALKSLGYKRVQLFAGGIAAWTEAGEKLETGAEPAPSATKEGSAQ